MSTKNGATSLKEVLEKISEDKKIIKTDTKTKLFDNEDFIKTEIIKGKLSF